MAIIKKFVCLCGLALFLASVSCSEESSNGECGSYGSNFRFVIVDKETGQDIFFGDNSLYSEDDLRLYVTALQGSADPSDTIVYLSLSPLERDSGRIFTSFLPAFPGREEIIYARIGGANVDTLTVTARSEGFYDDGDCERIVVDQVYYNGELVCDGCTDSNSYTIKK